MTETAGTSGSELAQLPEYVPPDVIVIGVALLDWASEAEAIIERENAASTQMRTMPGALLLLARGTRHISFSQL